VFAALTATASAVSPVDAQHRRSRSESRIFFGLDFLVADPVGEFGQFVDEGYGVSGHLRFQPDYRSPLSLRVGGGVLQYGRERQRACLAGVGCRIQFDVVTSNNIAFMDFGPEIGVSMGGLRPYLGASAGFSYFWTDSSVDDDYYDDYGEPVFRTEHFDDWVFAWRARGGLQARIGRSPVFIDMAAVYHGNGEAEYLTEGDIVDNPDGSITLYPVFSEANLVTFEFGVAIGLGGSDDDEDRWDDGRRW
jgi:hypothetical protein